MVHQLIDRPTETEWIEFKQNLGDPKTIGTRISGLANSAALHQRPRGYLVWGIADQPHDIVGTTFDPYTAKAKGNEDLIPWLHRALDPAPEMTLHVGEIEGRRVVILEIQAASHAPVQFIGEAYIRVGTYTKKLSEHPTLHRQLWRALDATPYEVQLASAPMDTGSLMQALDYESYYGLQGSQVPPTADILENFLADKLIEEAATAKFSVTNLGALLFANDLRQFPYIERKAARVIKYQGLTKAIAEREVEGRRGYASGFQGLVGFVNDLLPRTERIDEALRDEVHAYPQLAVRELIANALAHQDLSVTGSGPLIEIYDNRLEVTNPGEPLISPQMFINAPPRSRNEKLATMLRRCKICEERGSGWDRIGFAIEYHQLPAPDVRVIANHTVVTVHGPKSVRDMTPEERLRAVYLHACLRMVSREQLTNKSLRERFRMSEAHTSTVSTYIRDALDAKLIVPDDPNASRRHMRYVPYWAKETEETI
ncbi:putative DNA binding domain-containing protein [Mycobacterium koreense]|uniref:Transcriptional regulator n=1 Tax=Mycolicibacillus koreensis TaxID=1069220 RepID=A0AA91PAX8_9MYCO|nr:RNA-binding domain-containing protein [Mycolicibacillus koreensis]MCV7247927.1 putative DNA binding domain-containing protein [Mycolicibacillus koreensis]OSC24500.1 transcriptional regulator [Mycolicibacillus koreensis]